MFTLVLLAAVRLLSAIVLNTNPGKATSVVWGVRALWQDLEAWAQRWGAGKMMLGCIIGLFIPHLRAGVNHSASPLLKVMIQKEGFKSWICDCSLLAIFRYFYCLGRKFYCSVCKGKYGSWGIFCKRCTQRRQKNLWMCQLIQSWKKLLFGTKRLLNMPWRSKVTDLLMERNRE